MKILLHTCCAPCSIYPVRILREEQHQITGYYYRSNIHPYTESHKRLETLEAFAEQIDMPLMVQESYELEDFLRQTVFREKQRCRFCYHSRLMSTAQLACETGHEAFSSTLLYSKFQNHELIKNIGNGIAEEIGLPFIYHDFRIGWKEGIDVSKQMGMYRQQYCGCIYSEKDRYIGKKKP